MFRRVWFASITVAVCVALAACGDTPAPRAPKAPTGPLSILERVPADVPYALGMVEPLPESLFERYDQMFRGMIPVLRQSPEWQQNELMRAYLDELEGGLANAMDNIGFGRKARTIIYGAPLLPVMRGEILSSSTLSDTLVRILQKAKVPFTRTHVGAHPALLVRIEKMEIMAAFPSETEVVAGMFEPGQAEKKMAELVLSPLPSASLATSPQIQRLLEESGTGGARMVGFADTARLLQAALAVKPQPRSCTDDMQYLASLVPSFEAISTWRDSGEFGMTMRVVLEPALTAALSELRVPVPGLELPVKGKPLFLLGAGFDFDTLDALLIRASKAIAARPFRCPDFVEMNEAAAKLANGIHDKLPPLVASLKGGLVRVDELELGTRAKAVGHAFVLHEQMPELLAMMRHELPFLAGVDLKDGGEPAQVSLAMLGAPAWISDVLVGVRANMLAVSVGEDEEAMKSLLRATPGADAPLAVLGMDMSRYGKLMRSFGMPSGPPGMDAFAMFDGWGFFAYAFYVDDRGIVLRMTM